MGIENLNGIQWYKFQAIEKTIERDALRTLHGTGYTDCFRMHHIDTQILELDENGDPKKISVAKTDKKGTVITGKDGKPIMQQVDIVIIEGHTIPNKTNWKNFINWLGEDEPLWFCDFVDGKIVVNGNKERLKNKLREWELDHRGGTNKGKARMLIHPKQKKTFETYLDFTVTYWTIQNKHKMMSKDGWGFADPWVFQEMSRIINFNKTEIPKMYETVHKSLDTNMNKIIHEKVKDAVIEAYGLIESPLTDQRTDQLIDEISQRLEMDDTSITSLAQSIIDNLSQQMHQLFLKEKRNISPEIIDRHEDLLENGEEKSA
jgi:hypothetical protein